MSYQQYDSAQPDLIPAGHAVALYRNGRYAATQKQADRFSSVMWIDVNGSDLAAGVLDVETGDASPAGWYEWALHRSELHPGELLRAYCNLSTWPAVKAETARLPAEARRLVRYWVANPVGRSHLVPGSDATQWFWGQDWDQSFCTEAFAPR